jgi:hypothetical protein
VKKASLAEFSEASLMVCSAGILGFMFLGGNRHAEHLAAGVSMWNAPILVALFWH